MWRRASVPCDGRRLYRRYQSPLPSVVAGLRTRLDVPTNPAPGADPSLPAPRGFTTVNPYIGIGRAPGSGRPGPGRGTSFLRCSPPGKRAFPRYDGSGCLSPPVGVCDRKPARFPAVACRYGTATGRSGGGRPRGEPRYDPPPANQTDILKTRDPKTKNGKRKTRDQRPNTQNPTPP